MSEPKWECKACNWVGLEREIRKEIVFHATREEPDEWEWYCPDCNGTNIEEVDEVLCRSCEEEVVQHEGDQCTECYTCECEAMADEARGH